MLRLLLLLLFASPAAAQEVLLDPARTMVSDTGRGLTVEIALNRPAPWRVVLLNDPPRLGVEVEGFAGTLDEQAMSAPRAISGARVVPAGDDWRRIELTLSRPLGVDSAEMTTGEGALIRLRLGPVDAARFAELAESASGGAVIPGVRDDEGGPIHVMIDPGHGGRDPGAMVGPLREADLVMAFAQALRETLLRSGRFEVSMTREGDRFVPLESRVAAAQQAGADVFLSLHADALETGGASGVAIYVLGRTAEEAQTRRLVERHEGTDIVRGVDVTGQGDEMATLFADMARRETAPRSRVLAEVLVETIGEDAGPLYKRPLQQADFSVLKSADIPSVLIELGFISSAADAERLTSPTYRRRLAAAIRDALLQWALQDAAREDLRGR